MTTTASIPSSLVRQFADALTRILAEGSPITVAGITMFPPESRYSARTRARFPSMYYSGLSFVLGDGDAVYSTCLEGRSFGSVACNRSRSGILAEARRLAAEVEKRERMLSEIVARLKVIWDREYADFALAA